MPLRMLPWLLTWRAGNERDANHLFVDRPAPDIGNLLLHGWRPLVKPTRSPLKAVRAFCMQCQGNSSDGVAECNFADCPFYDYRHGVALPKGQHSPIRACKKYCHEQCQAGAPSGSDEVKNCQGDKAILGPCPVFPYRLGKNPNVSEETKQGRRERALKRIGEGTHNMFKTRSHDTFQSPELPESCRADL